MDHCGKKLIVSPSDIYATCPHCQARLKLRSFTVGAEMEDVFDAVCEWMSQPEAEELVRQRQHALEADRDA